MKKYTLIFGLLIGGVAIGQNYDDSTISVQLTQRMAYWVGNTIRIAPEWANRKAPDIFKGLVGNGNKPDSLFNITLKAKFLRQGIEALMASRTQVGLSDYRSILFNQPSIQGYTSLAAQIAAKANQGNATALYLKEWYEGRLETFQALYDQEKAAVVNWSNN